MSPLDLRSLLHFLAYTLACYAALLTCIHDGLLIALLTPISNEVDQLHWLSWIATTIQIEKPISILVYFVICAITPLYAWYSLHSFKRHAGFYQTLNLGFLISLLFIALLLFVDSYWTTSNDIIVEMLFAIKSVFFLFLLVLPSAKP